MGCGRLDTDRRDVSMWPMDRKVAAIRVPLTSIDERCNWMKGWIKVKAQRCRVDCRGNYSILHIIWHGHGSSLFVLDELMLQGDAKTPSNSKFTAFEFRQTNHFACNQRLSECIRKFHIERFHNNETLATALSVRNLQTQNANEVCWASKQISLFSSEYSKP